MYQDDRDTGPGYAAAVDGFAAASRPISDRMVDFVRMVAFAGAPAAPQKIS
jgi:hypothetical protein